MRVLITNANYQNALAAVRGLGSAGVSVVAAGVRRTSWLNRQAVSFMSKHCDGRAYYTDPADSMASYADDIAAILRKERIDVLCPIGIKEVMATLRFEDRLRPLAAIPFGPFDDMARANDKATAREVALSCSVPAPATYVTDDLDEISSTGIPLPVVVKMAVGAGSKGVWFADKASDFDRIRAEIALAREGAADDCSVFLNPRKLLVQEYVPGPIYDACVLADRGAVCAMVIQERVKTSKMRAGGGTLNVTRNVPQMEEHACALVKALNYHGPAQIEFKHDTRDGEFRLLEVNGKFWGTLALSIAAGVNFPYLAACLALDQALGPQPTYTRDLGYRWRYPKEILSWARTRHTHEGIRSLVSSPVPRTLTDWRWTDPLPGMFQMALTAWMLMARLRDEE